jgi:hypothetical protein
LLPSSKFLKRMTESNGTIRETPVRSRRNRPDKARKRRRVVDDDGPVQVPSTPTDTPTDDDFAEWTAALLGLSEKEPGDYLLKSIREILKDEVGFQYANVSRLWADAYESIETGRNEEEENIWMCGEVLDLFAYTLSCGRESYVSHLCSQIVAPFVYKDLANEDNIYMESLRNQICRIGVSKYTFWPVLAEDEHWILIAFEKAQDESSKDRALLFDSLNRKKYFVDAQQKLEDLQLLPYVPQWIKDCPLINVTSVKDTKRHQHDGKNVLVHSCGAWVCLYMELLTKNVSIEFIVNYLNDISATDARVGIYQYEKLLQKRLIDFVCEDQLQSIKDKEEGRSE